MNETEAGNVADEMKKLLNGRDPFAELSAFMEGASKKELRGLVLLATNRIGEAINGGEYTDEVEMTVCVHLGAMKLIDSFHSASMGNAATTTEVGNA